ncbi:MAG TPA: ABC transporter ATP-binding protein [Candidatus Hydrogenedentes bacterium]|nr:ABC transporter ATP-binding protein [Candidatus Hydrogenedentota bacterium]
MSPLTTHQSPVSDDEPLVRVQGASKKFCLSLKKSLWYGLKDMGNELVGRRHGGHGGLRPKEFWAVHDVSFELKRGECLGLIGRNGAGKTTLLKMLNGLIKPDAGRIEMRGRIGALISLGAGFNPILTGRENIYTNASVLGLSKKEIDAKLDEIIDFAEIGEFIDTPVQNYSSGMAVRLGFAVASSLEPDILLIDEVLAVGDLGFKYKCFRRISSVMERAAVIFVSHDMGSVASTSSKAMLMDRGRVMALSDDCPSVIQSYNGMFKAGGQFQEGTGDVDISGIRVIPASASGDGKTLRHGADMAVEFTAVFRSKEKAAEVVVNFLDQSNTAVAQCMSSRQNFLIYNTGKPQRIRMTFSRLPFNPGTYSTWIIVSRPRPASKVFSVHYGVCPFKVEGSQVGYIPIQPMVDWSAE